MKIGEKTLLEVSGRVAGLMRAHLSSINGVFGEEGEIKISMPVKMKMENGKIKIEVGCSFVVEKLEDTSTTWVDETQLDLPLIPMRNCPVNKGETRTEKFCKERCSLKKETIRTDEGDFVQYRSCSAWSDDDTHAHVTRMLLWGPLPESSFKEMHAFRIRNIFTNKWWEGMAQDGADACLKAGWKEHECEIKVKNENGAWCKYKVPGSAVVYKIDKSKKERKAAK